MTADQIAQMEDNFTKDLLQALSDASPATSATGIGNQRKRSFRATLDRINHLCGVYAQEMDMTR